jgi:serine/threonine protein phosphatase 1
MRTLAVGDIHGCLTALDTVLEAAAFGPDDRLVALGDFVDRGPSSRGTLDRLIALHGAGRLVPILGNHDEMFLASLLGLARNMWLWFGGAETLQSYGHAPDDDPLSNVPPEHLEFLRTACIPYYETERQIFTHATLSPELPLSEQTGSVLRWDKLSGPVRHVSGKMLICGHTRQHSGHPLVMPSTVCIDTGVYASDGWLTCLDVRTGEYWQANEKGQARLGHLDRLR